MIDQVNAKITEKKIAEERRIALQQEIAKNMEAY